MMAIWRRGKLDAVLHHWDQGSQYNGPPFAATIAHPLAAMAAKKPANQAVLRI
jgi:transposase InsO family protein